MEGSQTHEDPLDGNMCFICYHHFTLKLKFNNVSNYGQQMEVRGQEADLILGQESLWRFIWLQINGSEERQHECPTFKISPRLKIFHPRTLCSGSASLLLLVLRFTGVTTSMCGLVYFVLVGI